MCEPTSRSPNRLTYGHYWLSPFYMTSKKAIKCCTYKYEPTQRKPLIVCKEHCSYNVSNVTIIIVNADDVMKMEMIMV